MHTTTLRDEPQSGHDADERDDAPAESARRRRTRARLLDAATRLHVTGTLLAALASDGALGIGAAEAAGGAGSRLVSDPEARSFLVRAPVSEIERPRFRAAS